MGIFRFTRQNSAVLSEDWQLFSDLFQNIGAFTYRESVQQAFFDDNAQRILGVGKSLPKAEYQALLDRITEEPVESEPNLFRLRDGGQKHLLRLVVTRRSKEELGFIEEIMQHTVQLDHEQEFDELTGMPRFAAFSHLVQQRMQEADRLWLSAVHISGLDKVADLAVAGSANYCMASVAEVLARFAGEQVLLAAKGFQDFYICFVNMDEQAVQMRLQQMRDAVKSCVISDNFGQAITQEHAHGLDLHAGLAAYPEEGDTLRGLLAFAEFALFDTQYDKHKFIARFSKETYEHKKDEYRDEQLFNMIISRNQLTYHFQPIVDAHTGDIIGYEALMRSEHYRPDRILELAEKYGRLYDIEHATLYNCLRFLSEHQGNFSDKLLFINCIPSTILHEGDFNELRLTYEELFKKVVIEITEQSEGSGDTLKLLQERCREVGARIAVDDYGSGYANTATLIRYAPNVVKIDRELIDGICRNPKKQQLVAGTIAYAHDNQIVVLAEGVEEEDDLRALIRMGVDLFQGYFTARPTPYLLEEISKDVRDIIINTNLEASSGQRKIYNARDDEELDLVELALKDYTDIHVYRHQLTITGDPEKTVPMHIAVMDNHSCELRLRNVNMISQEKPCISVGSYAQLTLITEGENQLNYTGIRVPEGAYLHLVGDGSLRVDCYSKFGYGIGGDCDSSFGCIMLEGTGLVEIICNSDKGIGIGGGSNPDDSDIRLLSGEVHVSVGSPNAVGIGCMDGNAIVELAKKCNIDVEVNGISSVGVGALTGEVQIRCSSDLHFSGGGNKVIGIGVMNKGTGKITVSDADLHFFMRSNFGSCIGGIGGDIEILVKSCKMAVNAEGGEITGVGDARGSGDVTLEHTELKAYISASKPREAGSRGGQLIMHSSSITADINEQHNTTE